MSGILPLFGVAALLFNIDFSMPVSGPNPPPETERMNWENLHESLQLGFIVTWPLWGLGLILGMASGFYAPIKEPKNPLKSRFFRAVAAQTLLWWIIFLGATTTGVFLAGKIFQPLVRSFYASIHFEIPWVPCMILICISSFAFSLWRAINRALRASS